MMEMTQLSRPQATEARTTDTRSAKPRTENSEPTEFDQHLHKQIEQAQSAEKTVEESAEPVKPEENQPLKQEVSDQQQDQTEPQLQLQPQPALATVQLTNELQPDVDMLEQPVAVMSPPEPDSEVSVAGEDAVEVIDVAQALPQDGNDLPPAAVAGTPQTVIADARPVVVSKAAESAETVVPQPTASVPKSQPTVVESAATQTKPVEPLPAEFSSQLKNTQGIAEMAGRNTEQPGGRNSEQLVTAKTSLHMASIASAASTLQQVPLTTSVAAMHGHAPNMAGTETLLAASPNTPTLSSSLNTPVQHPAWSQGVAERVAWMVQGNFQSAELKLNPANLGPLEIKLSVHDDKTATVHFITSHAPVREALDAAMPRLRDMLESQGLNLVDVNVSDAGVQGNQAQTSGEQHGSTAAVRGPDTEAAGEVIMQESLVRSNGQDGVSIYA